MDVHVQIKRAAEALENRHRSPTAVDTALAPRAAAEIAQDGAHGDGHDRSAQRVIPGQDVRQAMRHAQHPLPHRNPREHMVYQVRGPFRHSPAPAAGAETAALALRTPRAGRDRTSRSATARSRRRATRSGGTPGTLVRRSAATPRRRAAMPPARGTSRSDRAPPGTARCPQVAAARRSGRGGPYRPHRQGPCPRAHLWGNTRKPRPWATSRGRNCVLGPRATGQICGTRSPWTEVRPGTKVSALDEIPDAIVPALGDNAVELTVTRRESARGVTPPAVATAAARPLRDVC
jgi:hypothetical protein